MSLQHKIIEGLSPLDLQNQVNIGFLMREDNEGREVEIVDHSYFIENDNGKRTYYVSVFYNSSLKPKTS
ncbi:MAG: hypothetical protein AABX48_01635 [Nanoarchaeota archaeon]